MVDPFTLGGALLVGAAAGALLGAGVAYATRPQVYYYLSPWAAVQAYPPLFYGPPVAYYPAPRYWAYPYFF